jgi:hypothetical protein
MRANALSLACQLVDFHALPKPGRVGNISFYSKLRVVQLFFKE